MDYDSDRKEWNLPISNNMDGPEGYYAKWNKSDREGQMPHDLTCMRNIKHKVNKQVEKKQIHRYRKHFDKYQRRGVLGRWVKTDNRGISTFW